MTPIQKFRRGDVVHVSEHQGPGREHFKGGVDAIIEYSYQKRYGGTGTHDYSLIFCDTGHVSAWYPERTLTFLRHGGEEEIQRVENVRRARDEQQADLDWIFANGESVLQGASGASVAALARCFGLTDLWGPRGEGITYYTRTMQTLTLAETFLRTGDKTGWIEFCKTLEITRQ